MAVMNVRTRFCKRKARVSEINKSDLKNFLNWQFNWLMASIERAVDHKTKYYIK